MSDNLIQDCTLQGSLATNLNVTSQNSTFKATSTSNVEIVLRTQKGLTILPSAALGLTAGIKQYRKHQSQKGTKVE